MLKIVTIIGARPQIIKAAALSRAIGTSFSSSICERIVHTGQHYDENMSQVFFDELNIPSPHYNLQVGSASHGKQTALMISGIEEILEKEKPQALVLYGDTNSTLAGAIAASKLHVPIVHIEAGLRSFNKSMPEEVNRILCDHVSTLLFSPTQAGLENLMDEGFSVDNQGPYTIDNPKIYHCGDVMYDNSLYFAKIAEQKTTILSNYGLKRGGYLLSTIHRNNNTDDPERLQAIFEALQEISVKSNMHVVLPLHPRTAKLMKACLPTELYASIQDGTWLQLLPPVSFLDMIALERNCHLVITDSGGVQKEAFFFHKPCVILRPETEWIELTQQGFAITADADKQRIVAAFEKLNRKSLDFPLLFGDGKAAEFICKEMLKHLS